MIFDIYEQVNAFTCHVDDTCAIDRACSALGGGGSDSVEGGSLPEKPAAAAVVAGGSCHRWCPLPHYAVLSCLIGFMTVAIFLRVSRSTAGQGMTEFA